MYAPGQTYYGELTTQSASTSQATDADSLPTVIVTRNGTDDAAVVATVTHADTGRYKFSFVIPSTYAPGDSILVAAVATVGGVTGKSVRDSFVLASASAAVIAEAPTTRFLSSAIDGLWTFRDLIELLSEKVGGAGDERNQRRLRSAIASAYREVANARNWTYLRGLNRIELQGPYQTGTVQYINSTRQLLLTGGTWPSWAGSGTVKIGVVSCQVSTRDSDTQLTLDPVVNFQRDYAAGTSYGLFRNVYPLPADFKSMCRPQAEINWWISNYVSAEVYQGLIRFNNNQGPPTCWTILADPHTYGGRSLAVFPFPITAETYDAVYYRTARPLKKTGYLGAESTGSVTAAANQQTLVGTSTSWDASMVGSIIRLGWNANVPDGLDGMNPYAEQFVITSVGGSGTLTVDRPLANNYTAAGFVVSDPVEFAPHMLTALQRCAEWQFSLNIDRDDAGPAFAAYQQAVRVAAEADNVMASNRVATGEMRVISGRFRDMPLGPNQ